jgi:epsin
MRAQRADEEDAEYKLAIEASKAQEEEDRRKRESRQGDVDDDDLAKAIKLSKEEEELRRRELEEANSASLFDDDPIQTAQPQFTGYNQGYQQQSAVDWSGNPIQEGMMPQQTGFYAQPTGYANQPQQTGAYGNGFANGFQQQQTGYDMFGQQPQQQQGFMPQATGYNPYAQQQQNQLQQQEPIVPANTNNPWATSSSSLGVPQNQNLQPTPTGSNNPFAQAATGRPGPSHSFSTPTLSTLDEQKTLSQFQNSSTFNPPVQQQSQTGKTQSPYEARLAQLLAEGDGMDTFGNVGNLRIPAQHTAPGTFVNSAGSGINKINQNVTGAPGGSNPFLQSQFTGMPQAQYQQQQQFPAQTGPANFGGGGGSNNPFGQRQQQQSGTGNLIDF